MAVVSTFVERVFVVRQQHDDPGSALKAFLLYVVAVLAGCVGGAIIGTFDPRWIVVGMAASLVGYGIELTFFTEPWKDGMTRGEFHDKWEKTEDLTHDIFSEEIEDAKDRSRRRHDE